MKRNNHYEVAFETYLRQHRIPFVAVEERYRSTLEDGTSIKSLDFVISRSDRASWLIDVKGRRFASGAYWKHWSTRDDLVGMRHWEKLFGSRFTAMFVFAYLIGGQLSPLPYEQLFEYKNQLYAFVGITVKDYLSEIRVLSPRWHTYAMPVARFRSLARPFAELIEAD